MMIRGSGGPSQLVELVVAFNNINRTTIRTSDEKPGSTATDAQYLMGAHVVVLVVEDSIAPDSCPIVSCESGFKIR